MITPAYTVGFSVSETPDHIDVFVVPKGNGFVSSTTTKSGVELEVQVLSCIPRAALVNWLESTKFENTLNNKEQK